MGVKTASTERSDGSHPVEDDGSETDYYIYNEGEETKLLAKEKHITGEPEASGIKYPKSVFFIIGNEFCERFSYYGLRTILTIYLTQQLYYSEDWATTIYHLFAMLAYFTPLLGAIIADSWLGKFRTIFYISMIYAAGNIIISVGSIPNDLTTMKIACMVGLVIVGFGTGGIKPCVAAFGGDQFGPNQARELQRFFSFFYLAINSGSVISTFLTPILREDVHCFGGESCYPLAFGIPAILMVVALVLFLCGKPLYKTNPPEGNIIVTVFRCICHALANKSKSKEKKRDHWLDYADDKFDKCLIKEIKTVLHVLVLYIPLPVYWALFDQQGSRWTLQATRMDGEFYGYHIKPDQMQVINPLMIIIFIPIFDCIVYPVLTKCHLLTRPLQKMTVGGLLAAASFVVAGFVELNLESSYTVLPAEGYSELNIINNSPCKIGITGDEVLSVNEFETKILNDMTLGEVHNWEFIPTNCPATDSFIMTFNSSTPIESMMITLQNEKLQVLKVNDTKAKSKKGEPRVRLFFSTDFQFVKEENTSFKLLSDAKSFLIPPDELRETTIGTTQYGEIAPGKYEIYIPFNETAHQDNPVGQMRFRSGGSYILFIYQNSSQNRTEFNVFTLVSHNSLSIIYQIPQYLIITAGEIMFSITGLEFSYSQSPVSMKSLLQAAWLLTVAFGNLIVFVITAISLFEKQSHELFMFATLMAVDMVIFAIMAYFYKYVTIEKESSEELETGQTNGKRNEAYEEETDFNK